MAKYLKSYQGQEMDFEEATRYKAYRDKLKADDPDKLKGVVTMTDALLERLVNALEARTQVSAH
jgi:hypothetical protein